MWAPAIVHEYLEEAYDVEYSISNCRRLLKESGLSYQKPRLSTAEADDNEQEKFPDKRKKRRGMDNTVVCIDQNKKSVYAEPRAAWFPRGSPFSVELSGQRDRTRVCLA